MKERTKKFKYPFTKEDFLQNCNQIPQKTKWKYLFEYKEDVFYFGIERGGHSGGYWYVAAATPDKDSGGITLEGKIKYIGPDDGKPQTRSKKILSTIGNVLLFIVFLPYLIVFELFFGVYTLIEKLIRKEKIIIKRDEKLNELMIDVLCCQPFNVSGDIQAHQSTEEVKEDI